MRLPQVAAGRAVWTRDERRGRDQVILAVYQLEGGGYSYSVQAKVGSLVRAAFPRQEPPCPTQAAARLAAVNALKGWTKGSPKAAARLKAFDLCEPCQRELFPELDRR